MKKQLVFMFSGQGSQYYQMGRELYDKHKRFKYWMDYCDDIVRVHLGTALTDVLYRSEGKSKPFDEIIYTNPALLCIEYALTKVLEESGVYPDFLLGYSLGEISANVISGVISIEEGIGFVIDIARLVKTKTKQACMLAIIESKQLLNVKPGLFRNCCLTGSNFDINFVMSGLPADIQNLKKELANQGKLFQDLPVKYGFHTELIDPVEDEYRAKVRRLSIMQGRFPIISSYLGGFVNDHNENYFWDILRQPVNFERTIKNLLESGDYIFIDVGPSGTLATFVKYLLSNDSECIIFQALNQFGRDLSSLDRLINGLTATM